MCMRAKSTLTKLPAVPCHAQSPRTGNQSYLQQHAGNPVDWHGLGEEALKRAREEDKPISSRSDTPHATGCHVMAHESFEDPAVAEVMNRLFVNVKWTARSARISTRSINSRTRCSPSGRAAGAHHVPHARRRALLGGTYFPKEPRYNLPGFPAAARAVERIYREHRDEIGRRRTRRSRYLRKHATRRAGQSLGAVGGSP